VAPGEHWLPAATPGQILDEAHRHPAIREQAVLVKLLA